MPENRDHIIDRPDYLKKIIPFKDKKIIKILTGVRRSGKSTLLELYKAKLLSQGVEAKQIQFINLEDFDHEKLREASVLHATIIQNLVPNKKNYVFLDEVQTVPSFGKVVNSLYLRDNIDLYL